MLKIGNDTFTHEKKFSQTFCILNVDIVECVFMAHN